MTLSALFLSVQLLIANNSDGDFKKGKVHPDTLIALASGSVYLYANSFNQESRLWYQPGFVRQGDTVLIQDWDAENGTELDFKLSPNHRYLTLDYQIKGYVTDEHGAVLLHENSLCVIIDIPNARVIYSMQSDCSGAWNERSQWISDNVIVFDGSN